jgi:RNA polymerase sigma-70 factor (ECF subfamily)
MSDALPPATRLTLIGALRQGLRWEEFVALYGRLILLWGRRDFGLQESDAENLCQEVLLRVWKGIAGYDPARGRFRSWLYACTRNVALSLRSRRPGETGGLPDAAAPEPPAWRRLAEESDLEDALRVIEQEGFDRAGLEEAVLRVRGQVQPATWKAFLLFEFLELSAREIAARLEMQPAAINQAVHRVRRLLQKTLAERELRT